MAPNTSIRGAVERNRRRFGAVPALFLVILGFYGAAAQKPLAPDGDGLLGPVSAKSDLYPATADARKEINEALQTALNEKKRVLLIFGANWCYDCHVLDHALREGDAGKIVSEKFLLVHVDIGEGARNGELITKYKIPLEKGVPAVVVLDANGKLLYSSGDGEFEAARKMMKRDLVAFLEHWKP